MRRRRRSRGQSLVEFALVLPILMIIMLSIVQFGILLSAHIGLVNSTREGARYGATQVTDGSDAAVVGTNVYCYIVGYAPGSSGPTHCTINGQTQSGILARSMPAFSIGQLCTSVGPNCPTTSGVSYCWYQDIHGGSPTYSVRLDVNMIYRHTLFVPLISAIVDGVDGNSDGALTSAANEQFRVEGPPLTVQPTAISVCP